MWVLEAWKDAEVVWYSIVWEEAKEASNVIDYNINEEITTNTSAVFNANNDTTTGMATVIPWVNAPKLLMDTSIYEPNPVQKTVIQTLKWTAQEYAIHPDSPSTWIRDFTTQSSEWTKEFVYFDSPDWIMYSWMQAPYRWTYEIHAKYIGTSSTYHYDNDWRIVKWWYPDDITIHTSSTPNSSTSFEETFTVDLNKWDCIAVFMTMVKWGSYFSEKPRIEMTITKL